MSAIIYEQLLHLKKAPHGSIVDGCEPLPVRGVGVSAHPDYSSNKRQGPCFDCLHQRCDSSFLSRGEERRGKASAPTDCLQNAGLTVPVVYLVCRFGVCPGIQHNEAQGGALLGLFTHQLKDMHPLHWHAVGIGTALKQHLQAAAVAFGGVDAVEQHIWVTAWVQKFRKSSWDRRSK